MKQLAIIILLFPLLFTSCDDSPMDLPELEFEEFLFGHCYDVINDDGVVIDDQNAFQALLDTTFQSSSLCDTTNHPTIDFSQYTLIGTFRDASGCSQEFIKHLYIDDINKKYIYSVQVEEEGGCLPYVVSMNWILVPKLPNDYTVEFLE